MRNYPKHCFLCHYRKSCRQKYHMKKTTKPKGGYITEAGDVICNRCFLDFSREEIGEVNGIYPDLEFDAPQHCFICGVPIKHSLSKEGVYYIIEQSKNSCCRELWPVLWKHAIEFFSKEGVK